jgi:L-iditol 2-dehydrogenase
MMSKNRVKAVVMVEPGRVEVQEFPYPNIEKDAMVIKVEMGGICGTDKHTYKGEMILYGGTEAEQRGVFPCVKGHEVVGYIEEIKQDVS